MEGLLESSLKAITIISQMRRLRPKEREKDFLKVTTLLLVRIEGEAEARFLIFDSVFAL
jgi:hypothetical protein